MAITFGVGRRVDPSGFGLAVVNIPNIDPEKNIALLDYSHRWEENAASIDRAVIKSYVDAGGHMPPTTITEFLVTNQTMTATNDMLEIPLWYKHVCRFYHYTYGENPGRQVYITDQDENILKDINYRVQIIRISKNVYQVNVLTDFNTNESTRYKVKYNRCNIDGSQVNPGWVENLNAIPLFKQGFPFDTNYEYSVLGPDELGQYAAVVPPVPTLSGLVNVTGLSFESQPTILDVDVTNNVSMYSPGVLVKYTLKSTGPTTYTIRRNYTRLGLASTDYLQSYSSDIWGPSPFNFTIGTKLTSLYGMSLLVSGDAYLNTGDEAYFTAKRAYYYLMPTAYTAIYLKKPEHVLPSDNWYIKVKNGRFKRRMNTAGEVVPSGQGIMFEYSVPEYQYQLWNTTYGQPYKQSLSERVQIVDSQTIQLQRTPLFIDPSSVLNNPENPGFAPTGFLAVFVNDTIIPSTGVLDWDSYNGTVKLAQILGARDDVLSTYLYEENFYEYDGFVGSGGMYTTIPPLPFIALDTNPTPAHNYDMYASGSTATIFLKPYIDLDSATVVNSECLYHNFDGVPSGVYDFKLGAVTLGPNCRVQDIEVTDVRLRSGGLSKKGISEIDNVKVVQPESEFFWDVGYFDGQAVPGNGVLVVRIPKRVLKSYGGMFSESDIKLKVQKHMALGEYPIIEYV